MQDATTNHRFKDQNLGLYSFSNEILVHCPQCRSKATVDAEHKSLSCHTCDYYTVKQHMTYYRLEVQRNCSQCGKRIELAIDKVLKKKKTIKISCKHCGFLHDYKPRYTSLPTIGYSFYYGTPQKTQGVDFLFHADLWLKKTYKKHIFWANNYDHLDYLKQYVQAKVRERNDNPRMSMIAKLPPFIKAKKNREDLLKIIGGLEKKS